MQIVSMWLLLTVSSIYDLTRKKIPVLLLAVGGAAGIAFAWRQNNLSVEWVTAVLPGLGVLLAAFASREKIGYGDGFLIIILGLLEGGGICFGALCLALLFISVCSMVLLAVKKVTAKSEIPFIPFLLAAHVCIYFLTGFGVT